MRQVVQPAKGGPVRVIDDPRPTEVLVQTVASMLSPGTDRAVTRLAQSSLLAKGHNKQIPELRQTLVANVGSGAGAGDGINSMNAALRAAIAVGVHSP